MFTNPNFVSNPKEITTGFINGDGFPDIVAAVPSGRAIEGFVVVNSNGSGGFNTPVYYEASQQTFDVAIVDLDNDGDGDVITLANSSAAVTVHENLGNGSFPVLPRYEVASLSDAVESADIDNDGDIDIVVNGEVDIASLDPVVKILKNNGNGTFAPAIDYTPTRNFADMKLRDINGDGFVDLIFAPDANDPPYHFGTALNLGNGTFAPTVVTEVFSCGDGTIDAADLDGDGDLDIVLTEEEGCPGIDPHIFIFRNDGNQNFVRMPDIVLPGILPHGLALADITGDGNIDIITALPQGMGVFPGNGNLTFGAPIISTTRAVQVQNARFQSDGLLDVGMILQQDSFGTDTIATALGNGNGTFQAIRTQTGSSVLENLRISDDLETGDVNGDGTPDLLVFNYASNDVSVFHRKSGRQLASTSALRHRQHAAVLEHWLILTVMAESMLRQRSGFLRAGFTTRSWCFATLAARHSRRQRLLRLQQQRRRQQLRAQRVTPISHAYGDSDANSDAHGNAETYSDRKTKGYAEAKANTRASGLSGK